MKLSVLHKDLASTLSQSSRFVSSRAQLPILTNIKLKTRGTKLLIQATNLEMSYSSSIGAQVETEGELAVSSRVFTDLIQSLRSEKVTLASDGESLKIDSEGFGGSLSGLNTQDFPEVPSVINSPTVLPKENFLDAVTGTIFSCSTEASRPALSGVLIIFGENLSLVASDGFRLSRKIVDLKSKTNAKIILPKAILLELLKISATAKNLGFEINESEKQILFSLDNTVLSSRLIEGEYPPFEKIIPNSSTISVSVAKEDFEAAIRTAAVFARDAANVVTLRVGESSLKISAESPRSGSQESVVSAKIEGPEISIPYNYRFIEEFLSVVKGEGVVMKFNSNTSPGVFINPSDESFLHLIMPVKS